MKIYQAQLLTHNFDFETYGLSESEAYETMLEALEAHGKQYRCADDWVNEYKPAIRVRELNTGTGYRDREVISVKLQPPQGEPMTEDRGIL